MQEEGRTHHQYCETIFQDIKGMVGDVQNKLGHMFFNLDDWTCYCIFASFFPSLWWMQWGTSK